MDLLTRRDALELIRLLTKTEKMIAWGLAWGFSYDSMAEMMSISRDTVKLHVHHIRRKMECQTYGIPLVLFLAEGLRKPDLMYWPGTEALPVSDENEE